MKIFETPQIRIVDFILGACVCTSLISINGFDGDGEGDTAPVRVNNPAASGRANGVLAGVADQK